MGFIRLNLGVDGLYRLIRSEMLNLSPISGDAFIVLGRRRNAVKILDWIATVSSYITNVFREVLSSFLSLTGIQ